MGLHMVVGFPIHRADQSNVIQLRCQMREDLRNFNAGLSVFMKFEGTSHQWAGMALPYDNLSFPLQRLAMESVQVRLRIECVHVADAAAHKKRYDSFGPRWKVRRAWRCR